MDFKEKKVIVTGASRSIGQRIALSFAENGADVLISYRNDPKGADETVQAVKDMNRRGFAIAANFSEMDSVQKFAQQAIAHLGHVDILINNAGMLCRETVLELPPEKMQQVFQVNTVAPLYLAQLCAMNMIERGNRGCIINISSIAGSYTFPKGIGYAASKAATDKWTKNVALDLAKYGIRVNSVAPGVIQAGMNEDTAISNPELWQHHLERIPLQRPGTPDDVANMVLYLASEKADWITGKVFQVDGGHVL